MEDNKKSGLQPMEFRHIKHFHKNGHDRDINAEENKAGRDTAVFEFLENELKFLSKLVIMNTKFSPVKDILWISIEETSMAKKIYKQAADIKNRKARIMMYLLSEYFSRIKKLEDLYKEGQNKDKFLRTKVRIGIMDIDIHTKKVGVKWLTQDPELYEALPEPEIFRSSVSPPKG